MKLNMLNMLIGIMAFIIKRINHMNKDIDIFETFNRVQEILEDINNEKFANFVYGLINTSMNNPLMGYFFIFLIYMTPILNLWLLISEIADYFKERYD